MVYILMNALSIISAEEIENYIRNTAEIRHTNRNKEGETKKSQNLKNANSSTNYAVPGRTNCTL